ncbi:Nse1 non-SMC component of SMC5-6 complex-domain-containing protein [Sordaria brevicollis]|uniref:Non-structural maintenance of chromosomes element 1 homolog n=1 Tax=Sordaria brevicollis TaxID=83679 RepID=A0AAE0PE04_SORBR|nr:Nse1 non-SMC component of SMC5-6 complex-domain-containing protein [Sordaria brevicollis]
MEDEWEPPVPTGYNDANRAFVQAFMARGTLTFPEGQKLLAAILSATEGETVDPESITQDDFVNFVRTAREAVEPLDYDIRSSRDQIRNGERIWAFINAHSDPPTQMATTHTPEEVAYIKRLMDLIFDEYNTVRMEVMAVDEGQALKASRPKRRESQHVNGEDEEGQPSTMASDRGLKHSEVLSLLSSLVAEGWLEKSRVGFYSLSPRSLIEMWSWLVATYNDDSAEARDWQRIKFCEACKEIVTYGQRCSERDCTIRLHDICQDRYWRTRREKKCPKCETAWTGDHFVGERAITSRQGYQRGKGRANGSGTANGRRSDLEEAVAAQQEAADEDEEMEEA